MVTVRPYWRRRLAAIGIAALGLVGCREELGPVPMPTTEVVGVVRDGERPVGGGWIEFRPVVGTVGNLRSAPIGPDGSFRADGVAVGVNQIGLVDSTVRPAHRVKFNPHISPIIRTIPDGPRTTLTLDLAEEATR